MNGTPRSDQSRDNQTSQSSFKTDSLVSSSEVAGPSPSTSYENQSRVIDTFLPGSFDGRSTKREIRARSFLTDRKIRELFNFLIGHLLVNEPDEPIDYLHDLLDRCVLFGSGLTEPPLLFEKRHIESLFNSLDPSGSGLVSLDARRAGTNTLGIRGFEAEPPESKSGHVDKETFVRDAQRGLMKMLVEIIEKSK